MTRTTPGDSAPHSGTSDWQSHAKYRGRIIYREPLADGVELVTVEKPEGFEYQAGSAIDVAIDEEGWRDKKRPMTMTSLPHQPRLEFIVQANPDKPAGQNVAERLEGDLRINDRLLFDDPYPAMDWKGAGLFVASGTGVATFVGMLRHLDKNGGIEKCRLFQSLATTDDVILQAELFRLLGHSVVMTLTDQDHRDYEQGEIDRNWYQSRVDDLHQPIYLCGPADWVKRQSEILGELGAKDVASLIWAAV